MKILDISCFLLLPFLMPFIIIGIVLLCLKVFIEILFYEIKGGITWLKKQENEHN